MADKSIEQLTAAERITAGDLFVLQQSGTAKKLTGQILLNWLTAAADGHGGISSIAKQSTSGLVDTYRITLADTTTFDFTVSNGKGITNIEKTATSGLVDTYTITYNDATTGTITVTNGAKGDKGDNAYIWIKYASQQPTAASHSMSDLPDDWIGIYSGTASSAPSDWTQYTWYQYKGETGATGDPASLTASTVMYQVSDSGTIVPSGVWSESIPVVAQGKYLWTRTVLTFNTGDPITSYSVTRAGKDGAGSVSSVCSVSPDDNGNVSLTASDVGALAETGGDLFGALDMNGQPLTGLNAPTGNADAANKGYVDTNFAPSGYGLGGNSGRNLPADTSGGLNAATANGWYYFGGSGAIANAPSQISAAGYGALLVVSQSAKNLTQVYFAQTNNYIAVRKMLEGVWQPWEYVNPPMALGAEYRTAERYNGKVVYAKAVSFGALPNTTTKTLSVGVTGDKLVSIEADFRWSTGVEWARDINYQGKGSWYFYDKSIVVKATADLSNYVAFFTLKYTKD